MKYLIYVLLGMSVMFASCTEEDLGTVDDEKVDEVPNEEDDDEEDDENDNGGDIVMGKTLTQCINRDNFPDFKVGANIASGDYSLYINKKEPFYTLFNSNFDEFVTGWHMKHKLIVKDDGTMDFSTLRNLLELATENGKNFYMHSLCWFNNSNGIYLNKLIEGVTDKEKQKEIILNHLEEWIKGVMNNSRENPDDPNSKMLMTVFEAVNETILSNGNIRKTLTDENPAGQFNWAYYLGDYFVSDIVKFARKYGGEDIKLFVNDYGLENYAADDKPNSKLTGLINWVKKWESKGVYIDGIGSQMHITYSLNQTEQEKIEKGVVNMLEAMKKTGKLIRITELDMSLKDEKGDVVPENKVTPEMDKKMGEFYSFIINKYFEILKPEPGEPDPRYGICHWSYRDPMEGEGRWKAGEPVGLWNPDYTKKATYEAYAKALEEASNKYGVGEETEDPGTGEETQDPENGFNADFGEWKTW